MEETKLLMAGLMEDRELIGAMILKHNELTEAHKLLVKKHNKLCKITRNTCLVCIALDIAILINAYDIYKLKKEQEKDKKKEG